jgi:hypothetical protein
MSSLTREARSTRSQSPRHHQPAVEPSGSEEGPCLLRSNNDDEKLQPQSDKSGSSAIIPVESIPTMMHNATSGVAKPTSDVVGQGLLKESEDKASEASAAPCDTTESANGRLAGVISLSETHTFTHQPQQDSLTTVMSMGDDTTKDEGDSDRDDKKAKMRGSEGSDSSAGLDGSGGNIDLAEGVRSADLNGSGGSTDLADGIRSGDLNGSVSSTELNGSGGNTYLAEGIRSADLNGSGSSAGLAEGIRSADLNGSGNSAGLAEGVRSADLNGSGNSAGLAEGVRSANLSKRESSTELNGSGGNTYLAEGIRSADLNGSGGSTDLGVGTQFIKSEKAGEFDMRKGASSGGPLFNLPSHQPFSLVSGVALSIVAEGLKDDSLDVCPEDEVVADGTLMSLDNKSSVLVSSDTELAAVQELRGDVSVGRRDELMGQFRTQGKIVQQVQRFRLAEVEGGARDSIAARVRELEQATNSLSATVALQRATIDGFPEYMERMRTQLLESKPTTSRPVAQTAMSEEAVKQLVDRVGAALKKDEALSSAVAGRLEARFVGRRELCSLFLRQLRPVGIGSSGADLDASVSDLFGSLATRDELMRETGLLRSNADEAGLQRVDDAADWDARLDRVRARFRPLEEQLRDLSRASERDPEWRAELETLSYTVNVLSAQQVLTVKSLTEDLARLQEGLELKAEDQDLQQLINSLENDFKKYMHLPSDENPE